MTYPAHFHYDRKPFAHGGQAPKILLSSQRRAADNAATALRFQPGAALIIGKKGVGKSLVLDHIARKLAAGFATARASAAHGSDIIRALLDSFGVQRKKADAETLITGFADARKRGLDRAIIIDDIDELDDEEMAGIAFILEKTPGLRIVASAKDSRMPRRLESLGIGPIVAKFRLKRPNTPALASLARAISQDAAALSREKNPLALRAAAALAFLANRSISDMDALCDAALEEAARENHPRAGLKSVWLAAKKKPALVGANLRNKAQRWFVWLVLLFMAYFAAFAIYERNWFKNEAEIRETLREQEAELFRK
ncbi:MAG: AAA family ATPase [Rickettsiales bacterium]|jgi:hypothetical protein|nr:AAA family ATPase [Rickettsiales bacterium]